MTMTTLIISSPTLVGARSPSRALVALCVAGLLGLGSAAQAAPKGDPLVETQTQCDAAARRAASDTSGAARFASICLLLGAAIAAISSATAGFVSRPRMRKLAGVTGAIAAVLAVMPKALPDPVKLSERQVMIERQRDTGRKVVAQLPFLEAAKISEGYRVQLKQYAVARFTECANAHPDEVIPDLPAPRKGETGLAFVDLQGSGAPLP